MGFTIGGGAPKITPTAPGDPAGTLRGFGGSSNRLWGVNRESPQEIADRERRTDFMNRLGSMAGDSGAATPSTSGGIAAHGVAPGSWGAEVLQATVDPNTGDTVQTQLPGHQTAYDRMQQFMSGTGQRPRDSAFNAPQNTDPFGASVFSSGQGGMNRPNWT